MSTDDAPASPPRPDLAARVVAWHNRHPLARRITAADVHSIGLVVLPHAGPRRLFSEDLIPEIGLKRLLAFAAREGHTERPAGDDWSVRIADLDRALVDEAVAAGPVDRADITLITAALMDGATRVRLLIGKGPAFAVIGPRVWSRPRIGMAIAAPLALAVAAGVAWWAASGSAPAVHRSASGAASAPVAASAPAAATASAADASPPAARASEPASAPGAAASASESSTAPEVAPPTHAASAPTVEAPQAEAPATPPPDAPAAPRVAAPAGTPPPAAAIAPRVSIVPNLRPRLGDTAAPPTGQHFALVSPPMRSRAEAEALLRRLRTETSKIRHPSAVETSLLDSAQGWRVSWWPFANRRQADNAQAALAQRRVELEVVDF
ncbi:SPOR domain-containing protein [Ideonella sp. A 288]|uniref:SPOR domain-containing protein n=1 Tax=Ideonella sp. A 288 TaxID=1962181 RepID=UPI000B4BA7AD|nr:SPOR domain-containing protein [Ideonella sp. A 288]